MPSPACYARSPRNREPLRFRPVLAGYAYFACWAALLLGAVGEPVLAQEDAWSWGWSGAETEAPDPFQDAVNAPAARTTWYGKAIWLYRKTSVPGRPGRRCPCYPSCSTYTLYSMQKYGFLQGFIMGLERLYIRENPDLLRGTHHVPIHRNDILRAYDPPEANNIFRPKDWRLLDPRFHPFFFGRARAGAAGHGDGPAYPGG